MRRVPRALALPRASTPFQCISRPAFSTSAASNGITDTLREKMWKPQRQPKEEARRGLPEDESYVPAKDGRGLRIVGLLDPVKDTEWVLESFKPEVKNRQQPSPKKLMLAVKRAYLEDLARILYPDLATATPQQIADAEARIKADQISDLPELDAEGKGTMQVQEVTQAELEGIMGEAAEKAFFIGDSKAMEFVEKIQLKKNADGSVKVDWQSKEALNTIIAGQSEKYGSTIDLKKFRNEEAGVLPRTGQLAAMDAIKLSDRQKFLIYRRIIQLTGLTISDAQLASTKTLLDLLKTLIPPPPRKKLHLVETTPKIKELDNVKVYINRVSPVTREKAKGRLHVSLARGLEIQERRQKGDFYRYTFEKGVAQGKIKGMQSYLQ